MAKDKQFNFRCDGEILDKLDEICELYGRNRTQIIEMLITGEWLKVSKTGKEKIQSLMSMMNDVQKALENVNFK